jgi:HEAT repeat protein
MFIVGVLLVLFPAVAQDRADRVIIESEQAREAGVPTLLAAVANGGVRSRILAARALGRLDNPSYRDALTPLLESADPRVRRAAAGALAQMRAPFAWAAVLKAERDASVRPAIFEAVGRGKPAAGDAESLLAAGLQDSDAHARAAAARGLESLFRLNSKPPRQPTAATLAALHEAFAAGRVGRLVSKTRPTISNHALPAHGHVWPAGYKRLGTGERGPYTSCAMAHTMEKRLLFAAFVGLENDDFHELEKTQPPVPTELAAR